MEEKNKYHFIYKITNMITNKFYVGMHSTFNLEDGYFGSGKILKYSVNKYGKDNHKMEILEFLPSREDLMEKEEVIINEDLLKNPLSMNLSIGGKGNFKEEDRMKGSKLGNEKIKSMFADGSLEAWNKGLKMPSPTEESNKKRSKTLKDRYKKEEHHSKGKTTWNKGLKGVQVAWNKGMKMAKKKKNKKKITREDLHKIELAAQRKEQVKQGFFDGRFKTKVVPNKKKVAKKKLARKKIDLDKDGDMV